MPAVVNLNSGKPEAFLCAEADTGTVAELVPCQYLDAPGGAAATKGMGDG